MKHLHERLRSTVPQHDTPLGELHPYWARKPYNVVGEIISCLTEPGDLVVDPFMGSGTTLFAAHSLGRESSGSDISALSAYIVQSTSELITSGNEILEELAKILADHRRLTESWFTLSDGRIVERVRYSVSGEYQDGLFDLEPEELVFKRNDGTKWMGRSVSTDEHDLREWKFKDRSELNDHLAAPIAFDALPLRENSRIAIPRGAVLGHFFSPENQASVNVYLDLVRESPYYERHGAAMNFLLSSVLVQLRMSDAKASSQWPFWRPRRRLTSRNPIIVLDRKMNLFNRFHNWISERDRPSRYEVAAPQWNSLSAQELTVSDIGRPAKLVLTDPPYGDQVPYLEYSALWSGVLNLAPEDSSYDRELVRSDAPHRQDDSREYLLRLRDAFVSNAALTAPDGYLAWFYQDQDLRCWRAIYESAAEVGMSIATVVPLPKQRRSLKTITSPGATLDGDLLCVFTRSSNAIGNYFDPLLELNATPTYFERYARLISRALQTGSIVELAEKYRTVKKALLAEGDNENVLAVM